MQTFDCLPTSHDNPSQNPDDSWSVWTFLNFPYVSVPNPKDAIHSKHLFPFWFHYVLFAFHSFDQMFDHFGKPTTLGEILLAKTWQDEELSLATGSLPRRILSTPTLDFDQLPKGQSSEARIQAQGSRGRVNRRLFQHTFGTPLNLYQRARKGFLS